MPLSDAYIISAMERGEIALRPFLRQCLQPNSYDLHLGSKLLTYTSRALDARSAHETEAFVIGDEGFLLEPNKLYLGSTEEYTETSPRFVPYIDGKSSVGRLGLWVHVTAGGGDAGFKGHFTLELVTVQPLRIYAGMPIAQIRFEPAFGDVQRPYGRVTSKYQNQVSEPVPSYMWKNWDAERKSWLPKEEE